MHKFFRAIGFANLKKRSELEQLIQLVAAEATTRAYTSMSEDSMIAVYSKEFASGLGITVCGEYTENNRFFFDYAYPYLEGTAISSYDDVTVERHAATESYAGVCDDAKIGVTLIFYLQNIIPYVRAKNSNQLPLKGTTISLSALSIKGTVMMPIMKNESAKKKATEAINSRNRLVEAARRGDEEAIESLTLDDMDTYTAISKKIQKEDVFTIVDTCFMPYGVECDQYSILGEIQEVEMVKNEFTGEEIYKMQIMCNELAFDLCINKLDLYGEPQVGRRFKGVIWLQGNINYPQ